MSKKNMGFCKEQETCSPITCHIPCPIGEELRNLSKLPKCKEACVWIKQGINGVNSCKDVSCKIADTIFEFRKK